MKLSPVFRGVLDAGYISTARFMLPLFSMGAYLYSGGPTVRDWRK